MHVIPLAGIEQMNHLTGRGGSMTRVVNFRDVTVENQVTHSAPKRGKVLSGTCSVPGATEVSVGDNENAPGHASSQQSAQLACGFSTFHDMLVSGPSMCEPFTWVLAKCHGILSATL